MKKRKKGIIFTSFRSSNIHQGCRSDYTFSAEGQQVCSENVCSYCVVSLTTKSIRD